MSSLKIADIVHYLTARRRVYDDAFAGDVLRMTKLHGDGPVQEAAKAARSAQAEASAETATR